MNFNWIQLMLWSFMIDSIIFSLIGIYTKKSYLLIISAILIVPLSLYLTGIPKFSFLGLVFPLFYVVGAIVLKKQKIWLSILFLISVYLLIGWLGYIVLNSKLLNTESIIKERQTKP